MDILNYTFKKREKFAILHDWLGKTASASNRNLDLGSAKGILSKAMRKTDGIWLSADMDWINVVATQSAVISNVIQVSKEGLPFIYNAFDTVVMLDFLEHLPDDRYCLREVYRIMKPGGTFIVSTPKTGPWQVLNKIKPLLGLTLSSYGHVREGYAAKQLAALINEAGFTVHTIKTYSYFVTECIEMILNSLYIRMQKNSVNKRDGFIAPASLSEYEQHGILFQLFKVLYPLLWWLSRLDYYLKLSGSYAIMINAQKK
jgi:2-polyprenyl-3-methyl-5-hydroxy-6-metoxy-1,4-benzoquinol methylase